jgi:hypothetical protein
MSQQTTETTTRKYRQVALTEDVYHDLTLLGRFGQSANDLVRELVAEKIMSNRKPNVLEESQ